MATVNLLDEKKTAALLDIAPRTLRAWRARGVGPRFLKLGRVVRYAHADLLAFMERMSRGPGGPAPSGGTA